MDATTTKEVHAPGAEPIRVGSKLTVYGLACVVRKVRPAGTVDVEAPNGRWYRVSGLGRTVEV